MMNWIKKLLSGSPAKTSQSSAADKVERAPRVRIEALHHVSYTPKDPPFADQIRLTNLSMSGLGLKRSDARAWPELGRIVEGSMQFDGVDYSQKIEMVRQTNDTMGARFVDLDSNLKILIRKYFEAELAALNVFEVASKYLSPVQGLKTRWIQGDGCELYMASDTNGFVSFSMLIFGTVIEYHRDSGLRSGALNSQAYLEPSGRSREADIFWESFVTADTKELGQKFISNITALSQQDRQQLAALLNR
jgi:hypothetical protein